MLAGSGRFTRANRLLRPRDFKRVLDSGERRSSGSFVVFFASRPLQIRSEGKTQSKLGITVSKRVGNAVVRNRLKRRVREWFRQAQLWLPGEKDIVVIARPAAQELSGAAVTAALDQLAQRPDAAEIEQAVVESQ